MKSIIDIANEVAERVWCDQEMSHCVMDEDAAIEIAVVIAKVLTKNKKLKGNHYQERIE